MTTLASNTKICIASSGLGHVSRGVEAWAHDLGHALHDRGMNVTLCKGGGEATADFERVIPCWQRSASKTLKLLATFPKWSWRFGIGSEYDIEQSTFALGLIRHLRRERIDILHVQDPLVARLVQGAHKLRIVPTRVILNHGTNESLKFLSRIDYLQHGAPCHLESVRNEGVFKKTWVAIPNFIDTDTFTPGRDEEVRRELGIPADANVILSVAAIKRDHKRIDYLIDEFAKLRLANAFLVVAGGEEPETHDLIKLGTQLLGERVRFLVRYPRERIARLYRAADVFVLGSLREMMPMAILEATASGLPCITHQHPLFEWMTGDGGQRIDLSTAGTLADAIGRLLNNEKRRRELANCARRHCVAHFSRDAVVEQILAYYRSVLPITSPATEPDLVPLAHTSVTTN